MIMDNMETIINMSLLSFAALAFVALLVSLELMKDETRRKVLEWASSCWLGQDCLLGSDELLSDRSGHE